MFPKVLRQALLFSTLVFSTVGVSQPIMKRSSFSGTYNPISLAGGATLSTATGDNAYQDMIPIGFSFTYLGTAYSTIGASTNGIVAFTGISASANNMNLYTSSGPNTVLAPWWDDLNVQNGTGSILYQLQGSPGTQTFTIQWTDVNSYSAGSTALLNFQVILYEQTNKIEFRYGAAPTGTFNVSESASIGIKSEIGGNGEYIDAVTGSCFTGNGMLSAARTWPARFFRFLPGTPAPLAPDVFTVGLTGDYYNLSEAVADLNHRGVAGIGFVVFSLIDSVYDETPAHGSNFFPVLVGPVAGASTGTTVHFETGASVVIIRSQGATAGNCVTQNSSTAIDISNEPVVGMIGADHISFATSLFGQLFIRSSSPNVDRGLLVLNSSLTDGTRYCGFQNLTIALDRTNTNSIGVEQTTTTALSSSSGSNSGNIYQSIIVGNAYAGMLISGDAAFPDSSLTIMDCGIGDFLLNDIGNGSVPTYGIRVVNQANFAMMSNLVRNVGVNGNAACTGILLESLRGTCNVYGNRIRNIRNTSLSSTSALTGISASVHTSGTHELYIFNNFISNINSSYNGAGSATVQVKGITVQSSGGGSALSQVHVDFNNVLISNASLSISSACFESGTVSGPVINTRNNIFMNSTAAQTSPAAHYCMITPSASMIGNAGSVSNHNNLFISDPSGGFIGKGNTTTYASLSNWQTAFSSDALSLNIDPMFANVLDLHVLNTGLSAMGMPLSWVAMDIDNQVRGSIPDIGADETFPPDPSPDALLNPVPGDCYTATEAVTVRVINAGDALLDFTQDTVPVTLQITGAITQSMTILLDDNSANNGDPLPMGGYVDVSFGTINMTAYGTYIFNVYTALPIDGNPYNDTLATVTINVVPPQVTISGNSLVCASTATVLTANASGGDGNYSYQWSSGLGTNSSATVSPSQNSTYYVSITDGCGMFANDSIAVNVLPEPVADFSFSQANNTVTFSDNSQNTSSWSWDFGDSQNSTQQNPSHTYTANGTYTVVLTSTNNCGTATDTAVISIITTGVNSLAFGSVSIYPNPVTEGTFTIYLPEAHNDLLVEIEDMNGKLLRKKEFGNTMEGMSFVTDVSGFENGIYFLRVSSDGRSWMQKIVIEN